MSENYVRGEESGHARLGMFDMLPLYVMDGNIHNLCLFHSANDVGVLNKIRVTPEGEDYWGGDGYMILPDAISIGVGSRSFLMTVLLKEGRARCLWEKRFV